MVGRKIGKVSRLLHVRLENQLPEEFSDYVIWDEVDPLVEPQHTTSDWIYDNLEEIIPLPIAIVLNEQTRREEYRYLASVRTGIHPAIDLKKELVEENAALKVVKIRGRPIKTDGTRETCGFYFRVYCYIWSDQDVVDYDFRFGNSSLCAA